MNILCCGRMKEGKTTLAIWLAQHWSPGVVIWDPRHMIDQEEAIYVQNGDELEDAIDSDDWKKGPIIFRPSALRLKEDFAELCQVLFTPPERFSEGGFALVVDEAAQLQTSNYIEPPLDVAIRQHPRSVLVIQTTHSLQDWGRASKDLMSQLYCFRQVGRSLQAVVDYCDEDDEFRDVIKSLPHHWCIRYNFEAIQGEESWIIMDDPRVWFTPTVSKEVVG